MSDRDDLRELVDYVKGYGFTADKINDATRLTGLPHSRVFDIWYGRARRIEQYETDAITDALAKKRREATRNELRDLQNRIARMEARLATTDPDFHRPSIDGLREGSGVERRSISDLRGMDRAARAKA